ncbi:diguanylate cyclase/phosphodiesterase (GGDEF & EAL domains) with PAS/PAC sensor(s) [Labilithrix luteola]|uniref:Diguanylate cyclase/phosphodiesterase (GGDEF & EAL domains) with PAS/PAC sensor(S) n=1 Tax=Labilithrix luteola TaxID=1391654 RepID=A0A0K1PLL8_9BACT|nr:diguanylate cyclase/phosphodiesterase (GGDEF & EAL domains) with PAS/PAC sensor(s) [Labilithrix luteola]
MASGPQDVAIDGSAAILLLEDNPGDATLVQKHLSRSLLGTHPVTRVAYLREAIEALRQGKFFVVITDLWLPDATGLEAVRGLAAAAPSVPLIVLSGSGDEAIAVEAVKLGAQDYLLKQRLNRYDLERAVRYAIERKRTEQRLVQLAHIDTLTGLANRACIWDKIEHAVSRLARSGGQLMLLDLDHFKAVNDGLGHDAGDELLRQVSQRMLACVRQCDTVARLGGDEFAILLEDVTDLRASLRVASRLVEALAEPIALRDAEVAIVGSLGVAQCSTPGTSVEQLLKAADLAMYRAKEGGGNTYYVYDGEEPAPETQRPLVAASLRRGLETRAFHLHYQPQVDLRTGRLIGVEALLRWRRPDGSLAAPSDFITVLEETGLIGPVGAWAIRDACARLREWRAMSGTDLRVAVNLSARQFKEGHALVRVIGDVLDEVGLPPSALELEITESLLMRDTLETTRTLSALKSLGVRIAIDDFGTGYSSLAYLRKFSVHVLKVDRSFVEACATREGKAVAGAIIDLGHRLGLEVVAEGVETVQQLACMRRERCDIVQGYLFARPSADPPRALTEEGREEVRRILESDAGADGTSK